MSTFVLKDISMTLDKESINKAIRKLRKVATDLSKALNELSKMLMNHGVEVAKMEIVRLEAVRTTALYESIYGYYDTAAKIAYIIAGAPYAVYVEYGTGIVGGASPHPQAAEAGWSYNVGDDIFTTKFGRTGWIYPGGGDNVFSGSGEGWFAFTEGMPARPFMYNTLRDLMDEAERSGGRVIAQYFP